MPRFRAQVEALGGAAIVSTARTEEGRLGRRPVHARFQSAETSRFQRQAVGLNRTVPTVVVPFAGRLS